MKQMVEPKGEGSDVTFDIDYELPGGFIGRVVDHAVAQGQAEREVERSLLNLRLLLERTDEAAQVARRDDAGRDVTEEAGHDG